jgi:hypothetical protein
VNSAELLDALDLRDQLPTLKQAIAQPLANYRSAVRIRGMSAPIELTTLNKAVLLAGKHVKRLCEWYLKEDLDEVEIEYIANALALCSDFVPESENVQNALYSLSELRQLKPNEREKVLEIFDSLASV